MKRITIIVTVLLMSLLLVSGVAAKRPPDPEEGPVFVLIAAGPPDFQYEPQGPDVDPDDPETWKHVKIRDLHVTGIVTLFLGPNVKQGTFEYFENINFNPGQEASTQQGDLTLCFGDDLGQCFKPDDPNDHIDVRFVGRATVVFGEDFPDPPDEFPEITVTNQPWNIKGGTGEFSHVHGNGARSTDLCEVAPEYWVPCDKYYGDIRL